MQSHQCTVEPASVDVNSYYVDARDTAQEHDLKINAFYHNCTVEMSDVKLLSYCATLIVLKKQLLEVRDLNRP